MRSTSRWPLRVASGAGVDQSGMSVAGQDQLGTGLQVRAAAIFQSFATGQIAWTTALRLVSRQVDSSISRTERQRCRLQHVGLQRMCSRSCCAYGLRSGGDIKACARLHESKHAARHVSCSGRPDGDTDFRPPFGNGSGECEGYWREVPCFDISMCNSPQCEDIIRQVYEFKRNKRDGFCFKPKSQI